MDAEIILGVLLWIALACAILLILVSAATVGRKASDLEYQREAGINGVRQIQAVVNIRTHALRVCLGSAFVVITVLLLADAPTPIRTWTNRILFALLMGSYLVAAVQDWLAEQKQLRILQAQANRAHAETFAAGVKQGESDAGDRAEALALSGAPLPFSPNPTTGATGPAGPAGIQGPVGPQGQAGPQGRSGTGGV